MAGSAVETAKVLSSIDHLGLLAGEGEFPVLIARAARGMSIPITGFGIKDLTPEAFASEVDQMHWLKMGKFDRLIDLLHDHGISKIIMAGRIRHTSIFRLFNLDRRGLKVMSRLRDFKADSILQVVSEELLDENIEVLDSTMFLRELMPAPGLLTPGLPPHEELLRDIAFGLDHARKIAGMDIGQTIVVKRQSVVAVEAMEGTDETIERAGRIAGPGCVMVKVSKPRQDSRFDVPVIGLSTIRNLIKIRAAALAFPGDNVLFFNQAEAIAAAQENELTILALECSEADVPEADSTT